jgi:hypothetical protein
MKQLVEYKLENNQSIIVEVDLPEAGIEQAGRDDQTIGTNKRFGDVLEQIQPVAQTVFSKLGNLSADEIGVDFGIKLSAKAGIVIASAESEANFTVKLTWKRANEHSQSYAQTPSNNASLNSE